MAKTLYPQFKPIGELNDRIVVYDLKKLHYHIENNYLAGASCSFLHNNASVNSFKQYSLKVFWNEQEAKNSYKRQKLASKINLAPSVGKMFVVKSKTNKIYYWGYHTGRAGKPKWIDNFNKIQKDLKIKLKTIVAPSSDLPPEYATDKDCHLGGDLHIDNIGIWNGLYVCIDFGHHSLVQTNGRKLRTNFKW